MIRATTERRTCENQRYRVCLCVCVRVRSKMYSMLKADENNIKKAKGVKRTLSERINNASTVQGNAL